jgi:hypothetical protein
VVAAARDLPQQHKQGRRIRGVVIVEERMPSVRVLLHIMVDAVRCQCSLKPAGCSSQRAVLAAVAADDRAGASQEALDVLRDRTVVDA